MSSWPLPMMALAACAGLAAGWLFFATLAPVAGRLAAGRLSAVGLQMLRFAALAGVLFVFTRGGPAVFLSGVAGVFLGRALLLRKVAR